MYIQIRDALAEALKKSGYRVISPYKVPIGWVDIVIRGRYIGIDIVDGSYESSVERLSSYPFREIYLVGNCEGCLQLEEFCKSMNVEIPEIESTAIHEDMNMTAKAVVDAIAFLYIAGEVYEDEIEFNPLKMVLPDLKRFGLATSSSRPKFKPKFFVSLSREGYTAARKIISDRLRLFEGKLRKLASPLTYVLALGLSRTLSLSESRTLGDYSYKSVLQFMRSVKVDKSIFQQEHPKAILCEFLTRTVLNGEAVKLAKRLCEMGLAIKIKTYSPFGDEIGEEYRFAREAIETLMKFSYAEIPRDAISEFLAVAYPMVSSDVFPVLRYCRDYIAKAERSGICRLEGSKLVKSSKFEEYAKVRLAMIADKVIEGLSL